METYELYSMTLHSKDLDNMAATDKQKALIDLFNMFSDSRELINEIEKLDKDRKRHNAGVEFCGDISGHYTPLRMTYNTVYILE